MRIVRKINNSAAVAQDSRGKELIVIGKGIGFPAVPYELTDMSRIDRTFYDIDPRYFEMISTLPQEILLASADITEDAQVVLNTTLNSNLPLTLADHLNFAVERFRSGLNLTIPIAYDIRHLYPNEFDLGVKALDILKEYTGVSLPDSEAVSIAMHLINAEIENSEIHSLVKALEIQEGVESIVEREMNLKLDKDSYSYYRFTMHIRYLIQRLMSGTQSETGSGSMVKMLANDYPKTYICAKKIAAFLQKQENWCCNDEELLYLMLHINRVCQKNILTASVAWSGTRHLRDVIREQSASDLKTLAFSGSLKALCARIFYYILNE